MDLAALTSDLKCSTVDRHLEFLDDNVKKMKSGLQVDVDMVNSVIASWSLILGTSEAISDSILLKKCILFLRVACAQGSATQTAIMRNDQLIQNIKTSLSLPDNTVTRSTWQLCANLLVQCPDNVEQAMNELLPTCLAALETTSSDMDTIAAVIYNLLEANKLNILSPVDLPKVDIYRAALNTIYKHQKEEFTFLQFLIEDLLCREPDPKESYYALGEDRVRLHQYLVEYVASDVHEMSSSFLRVLSENFNRLSDNILTWFNGQVSTAEPKELLSLLECLSSITGNHKYTLAYKSEASMFINSGALLVACCESQKSELAPKAKLTDFEESMEAERDEDPFYDFKTLLIRLIGNLAYKNKKNQDYARDLKILFTVCGCTTLDARNPLMKEWAILAIRNLLENNLENQKLIHQLTQQGRVNSDVVKEFQPESGFMRLEK